MDFFITILDWNLSNFKFNDKKVHQLIDLCFCAL